MPRPPADPIQHFRAHALYRFGMGPTAIHRTLETEFEKPVSKRTIAKWVKRFKSGEPSNLDAPFKWHNLGQYELPWESSDYLMAMWVFVIDGGRYGAASRDGPITPPTVRQMKWCWRVHLVCPGLQMYDVFWVAQRFTRREIFREVIGEQREFDDLEAYLAYKPWSGTQRSKAYEAAIQRGSVQPLLRPDLYYEARRIESETGDKRALTLTIQAVDSDPAYPPMLPSLQTEYIRRALI